MTPKPKEDNPEQSKRFIEAAREAEASESEKEAEKAVLQVIRPSPGENPKKRPD